MRGLIAFLLVLALLGGAGYMVARLFKPMEVDVPTVAVRRGDLLIKTYTRGDVRAVKSAVITAPNIGGSLSITKLAPMGSFIDDSAVVLAFDPAEQENNLAMHQSTLEEAEQQIIRNEADLAIREQSDKVELLRAEFAVRRAELDVSRNELVSEIDARKNELALEAARKRLAQLKEDFASRQKSGEADLAVVRERRNKAMLDVQQAKRRIEMTTIRAPMSGLVNVRQNRFAAGGMFFPGMDIPDYRVGDQASSGDTVLEVVDTAEMEVNGRINELDRGNISEAQDVLIRLDPLPGVVFHGKVKSLSGMASRAGIFASDPNKTFDITFSIAEQDPRLRPGMSAEVEIITQRISDAVFVPLQAVFEKEGKKWVFVKVAEDRFTRREVATGRHSESQVEIISGLDGGEQIALLDPETRPGQRSGGRSGGMGIPTPGR
jgi:HlyD family secretion protein